MSFNALLVQRRVQSADSFTSLVFEPQQPGIRIPTVTGVQITTASPGGWLSADFVIPAEYNRTPILYNTQVWIHDGLTLAFMGFVSKSIPQADGSLAVSCAGSYDLLGRTLMRSVWSDRDLSKWQAAPGSIQSANLNVNANGNLVMAFPKDHQFPNGSYVAADYFLFNETVGPRDAKLLDGFQITIGSSSTVFGAANMDVRIYGLDSPGDASPTLIHTFGAAGSRTEYSNSGSHGTRSGAPAVGADNGVDWANNAGYRCLRIGIYASADTGTVAADKTLIISTLRVSTRANGVGFDPDPSTVDIAVDLWNQARTGITPDSLFDMHSLLQPERPDGSWQAPVVGISDSGTKLNDFAVTEWTTPRDILESLAAIDGYDVGLYGPQENVAHRVGISTSGNGGYSPTTQNPRFRRPAALVYQQWNDLSDPDYHARLHMGAVWDPDPNPDPLLTAAYVLYQTIGGFDKTVYVEDASNENYLDEQGWHEAVPWSIDNPVSLSTAQTLGTQFVQRNRQPSLSGTLTVYGDRPGSLELPGGARIGPLHQIRPGVIRIVDAKGPASGIMTDLAYTARGPFGPEQLVIHINRPAAVVQAKSTAKAAKDHHHHIHINGPR